MRYKGKLPPHVQPFNYKQGGKRRVGYFSKLTGKRIAASVIRKNKDRQILRERFPNLKTYKNIEQNFLQEFRDAVKNKDDLMTGFLKDRYGDLYKYLAKNAPSLLGKETISDFDVELDEEETDDDAPTDVFDSPRRAAKRRKTKVGLSSRRRRRNRPVIRQSKVRKRGSRRRRNRP